MTDEEIVIVHDAFLLKHIQLLHPIALLFIITLVNFSNIILIVNVF